MKVEAVHDVHQNAMAAKTGVLGADAETESRVPERPRLNLKPRSNLTGQSDEIAVKERYVVFRFQILFLFFLIVVIIFVCCNLLPVICMVNTTCPSTYFGFHSVSTCITCFCY